MGGLILIFLMIAWPIAAFFIARAVFKNSENRRRTKIAALALTIALAPVAEELYIVSTFSFYCWQYAGITKLNPVEASAVEISAHSGWSPVMVVEHSPIKTAITRGNDNGELGSRTLWITKTRGAICDDPLHQALMNSKVLSRRVLPRMVEKAGYCYNSIPMDSDPDIILTGSDWYASDSSIFYLISEVEERRFSVVRKSTSETLSELVLLTASPGQIRRSVWPYYYSYSCPAVEPIGGEYEFPFKEARYTFLKKAIISEAR